MSPPTGPETWVVHAFHGHFYVWDPEVAMRLRRDYQIVGSLVGSVVTTVPTTLGPSLPLLLSRVEVLWLLTRPTPVVTLVHPLLYPLYHLDAVPLSTRLAHTQERRVAAIHAESQRAKQAARGWYLAQRQSAQAQARGSGSQPESASSRESDAQSTASQAGPRSKAQKPSLKSHRNDAGAPGSGVETTLQRQSSAPPVTDLAQGPSSPPKHNPYMHWPLALPFIPAQTPAQRYPTCPCCASTLPRALSNKFFPEHKALPGGSSHKNTSALRGLLAPVASVKNTSARDPGAPSGDPPDAFELQVFTALRARGFYMTPGTKFGGRWLVYPGEPSRFHSHYVSYFFPSASPDTESESDSESDSETEESPRGASEPSSSFLELVRMGRMGTYVKKNFLVAGHVRGRDQPHPGATGDGIVLHADPPRSVPPAPIDQPRLHFYSVEWTGWN